MVKPLDQLDMFSLPTPCVCPCPESHSGNQRSDVLMMLCELEELHANLKQAMEVQS